MVLNEQRRLIAPLFRHRLVTGRLLTGCTHLKIKQVWDGANRIQTPLNLILFKVQG